MSVVSTKEDIKAEQVMDDLTNKENKEQVLIAAEKPAATDENKLATLKAKLAEKNNAPTVSEVKTKKERSINFGVVGSGQSGSRLAEQLYRLGYDAVVMNTAPQDLKFINIPDSNKLLLEYGLGGAAKDTEIGKAAAEMYREQIEKLVNTQLSDAQVLLFALSLGGGSGAGSCETIVDILSATGKPLCVITVLPTASEDAQTKSNALNTLSKLASFTQSKKVNNLIVVDNAKIETIYKDISQIDFFNVANKAIIEPIDMFNTLSSMPSPVKPLDPMEFSKILLDGEGLTVYGELTVDNYAEDTALAEAIIGNLSNNLLAEGFDLKQARYVGYVIAANKDVWAKIPASSVEYANSMINDLCGYPKGVFKGIYVIDTPHNVVKIYSMFSGLSLPSSRVEQLKTETKELHTNSKSKDDARNLSLKIDMGTNDTISEAQRIKNQMSAKKSGFGKLTTNVIDRRK